MNFSYKNLVSNSNSICCDENDEEAMMLAIEVAETAAREEMQSLFRDSMDLIHRLFVCISGWFQTSKLEFANAHVSPLGIYSQDLGTGLNGTWYNNMVVDVNPEVGGSDSHQGRKNFS